MRKNKISHCWEYFKKNSATDEEAERKALCCQQCNYKLGWDIGLITDDFFKNTNEKIFIDELISEKDINKKNKLTAKYGENNRFCYDVLNCNNENCPVRKQQIIKCFEFFKKYSSEEKKQITECSRNCQECFYLSGWNVGLLENEDFSDVIKKKKTYLKNNDAYKKKLMVLIFLNELSNKSLSQKEEMDLAKKIAGDKKASEIFLLSNIKLVSKIAKNYTNQMPYMDLIQEGNIGLIKAISKFDSKLGYKFSTYAAYWIKYYMQKAIAEQSKSISIPCHLIAVANKIKLHIKKFEDELARNPTLEELSNIMDIPQDKLINIINITKTPISINSKISKDGSNEEIDYYLEDKDSLTPEESYLEKQKSQAISEAIKTLDERYRYVVENYFGLNCEEISMAEIGRRKNISRERVRQILHSSLLKLSKHSSIIDLKSDTK